VFLTKRNGHESKRARQAIADAADQASEILSNTRTVARSSYIHSSIIEHTSRESCGVSSARPHPYRAYQDRKRVDALPGKKSLIWG
jgi:DNA topoisomerase IB